MFSWGSKWLRIDFHLHTVQDKEFKYKSNRFYDDYIEKLKEEDIRIGIITNHNKFNNHEFKELRKRAKQSDIYLIPGVELTVKEGHNAIHTLIAFKEEEWLKNGNDDINNFLNQVFTGIENRENENTRCKKDLLGTIEVLDGFNKDYFIIFAHIEQKSGFLHELGGGAIKSLAKNPGFKKNVFGFQKLRTRDNIARLKEWMGFQLAFVEGSDPKRIDEIGKGEPSYIKLGTYSFDAVKLALRDFNSRMSSEYIDTTHAYIKSVEFTGGKMDGQQIKLSPGLNTLIGIRGSGKSSILEILRYGLGLTVGEDKCYKEGLVENTMASGGVLEITLVDKHKKEYKVRRILNEPANIIDEDGSALSVSIGTLINNPLYFGQKDLSKTENGYEFNLLDKLLGDSLGKVKDEISAKENSLVNSINLWRGIEDIDSKIKELEEKNLDLAHRMKMFEDKGVSEKLKKQTTYNRDKRKITNIEDAIDNLYKSFETFAGMDNINQFDQLKGHKTEYNIEKFKKLDKYIDDFKEVLFKISSAGLQIEEIIEKVKGIKEAMNEEIKGLQEEFAKIKREINEPNLNAEDYVEYSKAIGTNKGQIVDLKKKKQEKNLSEMNIKKIIKKRNQLLMKEFDVYKAEIDKINTSQTALKLNIIFKGNKDKFKCLLKSKLTGTGITGAKYDKISERFSGFVEIFEDIYFNNGIKLKKIITDGEFEKIKQTYGQEMEDLIKTKVPNSIQIDYHGKSLNKHSLGQRASALVLFILTQEDNDLIIIDQPEDDLDNQVIYKELISTIRSKKRNVQFIFATHNANIPVLGDAEQVTCTNYNEEQITFESGSIDVPGIQTKIIDIMEGGPEAFEKRNNIYKLWDEK